jgi:hypothetical protein
MAFGSMLEADYVMSYKVEWSALKKFARECAVK